MYFPFVSLVGLLIPSTVVLSLAALPIDGLSMQDQEDVTLRWVAAEDDTTATDGDKRPALNVVPFAGNPTFCFFQAADEDAEPALPKVWIGVRITPVPAPLAAHVGEYGVMVANVYKDGPADQAGLEQYDVIVGLGGNEIKEPKELPEAIAKMEPAQSITLTVVRKATRQDVTLALAARPAKDAGPLVLKYEEPGDNYDAAVQLYGKALRLDPGGHWVMQDLGSLYGMPDVLKKFDIALDKFDIDCDSLDLPGVGSDFDIKALRKLHEGALPDDDANADRRIEVRVRVTDDGQTTTVQQEADGKIQVTRTDADGNESTAAYDNAEAMKEADPDADELYQSHAGRGGARAMIRVQPFGRQALKLRQDFQVDVQKRLMEAFERAHGAAGQAAVKHHEALEKAHEAMKTARVTIRKHAGDDTDAKAESLLVFIGKDGTIQVTVSENGETSKYEFKSKADFEAAEPELYSRVREMLP